MNIISTGVVKSVDAGGIRLYKHYQPPSVTVPVSLEGEYEQAQTVDALVHYCRQSLQHLIMCVHDPKLGDQHIIHLSVSSGIIQKGLSHICNALTWALKDLVVQQTLV